MRGYSVGEDNIVLEAALIVGVHKRRGRHGGINELARKLFKTHKTLCQSRGLVANRTFGSLKMRMYRLFCTGIMRWGSPYDKKQVFHMRRAPLRNIGTSEQKAKRDYLINQMFDQSCSTLSHIPAFVTNKKQVVSKAVFHEARHAVEAAREKAISHEARQAVEAARISRRARRAAARENESSTGPCHAIANPQESRGFPAVEMETDKLREVGYDFDKPRQVVLDRIVEERKDKMSVQQAYKESLKAVRELAAMRHEALEFMRREYESYNDFLKKSLAELAEQQRHLLRMMGTESRQ